MAKERGSRTSFVGWLLAVIVAASTLALPAHAASSQAANNPRYAALVIDGATGNVLYSRNASAVRYPASLTKMMTLYLLFEALDSGKLTLNSEMEVSARAAAQEPTKLNLKPGEAISVETAIKALVIRSANDVAVVIAETLSGSETAFAAAMTAKARELGMTDTVFRNASGLPDPGQKTTAADMAQLGRHLAYDFPHHFGYFALDSFTYRGRRYETHDRLLAQLQGTDGIKTGFTRMSGFNLVTSVVRDNKHLIGVVMGGTTAAARDKDMVRLLTETYDRVKRDTTLVADSGTPWLTNASARGRTLVASASQPIRIAVPLGKPSGTAPVSAAIQVAEASPSAVVEQGDIGGPALSSAVTEMAGGRSWIIQIGAYADEVMAQGQLDKYAARSMQVIREATRMIIPFAAVNGQKLYRARFGLFTEDEARNICLRMAERGETCFAARQDS